VPFSFDLIWWWQNEMIKLSRSSMDWNQQNPKAGRQAGRQALILQLCFIDLASLQSYNIYTSIISSQGGRLKTHDESAVASSLSSNLPRWLYAIAFR
jgi:hypothetical protein